MPGGGSPSPLNGGEYLLQLLQKPPHQPRPPPPPTHTPHHDPAIAAVGPTFPFSPFLSNSPYTPPFAPHSFFPNNFPQNLNPNPNPNPNPSPNPNLYPNWSSPPPPGFNHNNQQYDYNLLVENTRTLGSLGTNSKPISSHQRESSIIFGSFGSETRKDKVFKDSEGVLSVNSRDNLPQEGKMEGGSGSSRRLNGVDVESHNSVDFDQNPRGNLSYLRSQKQGSSIGGGGGGGGFGRQGHNGNFRSQEVRRLPPGFSSKQRGEGNWESGNRSFEHNSSVDKGKSKFGVLNQRGAVNSTLKGEENERQSRFSARQSKVYGKGDLHSVLGSDVEESLVLLHAEVNLDGEESGYGIKEKMRRGTVEGRSELDDLDEEQMGSLSLENGVLSDEKNDRSQHRNSRDKDYRSDKRGQWVLGQKMRNFKRQVECRSDINRLNAPFLAIYESLIPAEEEKAKQKQLLMTLEKLVSKEWPEARLYLYGSCANSFGFPKSDLDVCLAMEDADVNKSDILLKLAEILQSDNLQNVQALTRARVPIVKLMDPATGISCDICVNNVLAVINTKLLRDYAQIDVRLRQLAFIVKHWAKSRGVNETYQGTLSSYAYVLMCIHFLQLRRPAVLPCLQGMNGTYSGTFDNIECTYFDQVEKLCGFGSRNGESIAQLVSAFFNYWAYCHDYTNDVISVRTGSLLSKRAKDWTRRIGNDRHLICIEDPFEVSHDLGRVVDKYSIRVLREEFERAAEIMQYDPNPSVTLFEPYVPS